MRQFRSHPRGIRALTITGNHSGQHNTTVNSRDTFHPDFVKLAYTLHRFFESPKPAQPTGVSHKPTSINHLRQPSVRCVSGLGYGIETASYGLMKTFTSEYSMTTQTSKTATLPQGSISYGTMRDQDLAIAFIDALTTVNRQLAEELSFNRPNFDSEAFPYWLNEEVWDALQAHCPEGFYFGAHPGDGSDYGVWPVEMMD